MDGLRFFLRMIDTVSKWVGKLASLAILIIIIAVIWDVVLRYVFNAGPLWGFASYGKLLLFYVVFGASYTLLTRSHVNVDIAYQRFSLRVRAAFDVVTALFFFLFCMVLIWEAIPYSAEQAMHVTLSPAIFFPAKWPIKIMLPLGLIIFLFQGLAKFIRDLLIVFTGKEIV